MIEVRWPEDDDPHDRTIVPNGNEHRDAIIRAYVLGGFPNDALSPLRPLLPRIRALELLDVRSIYR